MAEITGRHVLLFTVGAFGVIIGVNVLMAYKAISTFPGLEVQNSYVASQGFDARRSAQQSLGWTMAHSYNPSTGRLVVDLTDATGAPADVAALKGLLGRTTEAREDQTPDFVPVSGAWEADAKLGPGKWLLKIEALSTDGTLFEQRVDFFVRG